MISIDIQGHTAGFQPGDSEPETIFTIMTKISMSLEQKIKTSKRTVFMDALVTVCSSRKTNINVLSGEGLF